LKFSRSSRLLKKSDFEAVFQDARDASRGFALRRKDFTIYFRPTNAPARLGISVPKKVVRQAVRRNRIKRCLREYFRLNQDEFLGDIIVRLTKAPKNLTYQNLVQSLEVLKNYFRGKK
jgi:ribonuclease P protein component